MLTTVVSESKINIYMKQKKTKAKSNYLQKKKKYCYGYCNVVIN